MNNNFFVILMNKMNPKNLAYSTSKFIAFTKANIIQFGYETV